MCVNNKILLRCYVLYSLCVFIIFLLNKMGWMSVSIVALGRLKWELTLLGFLDIVVFKDLMN